MKHYGKIKNLKKLILDFGLQTKIQVDGNVSPLYIADMVAAGADILVGGSSGLFRKGLELKDSIQIFKREIERGLIKRKGSNHELCLGN